MENFFILGFLGMDSEPCFIYGNNIKKWIDFQQYSEYAVYVGVTELLYLGDKIDRMLNDAKKLHAEYELSIDNYPL